jgi:hypothetical protein
MRYRTCIILTLAAAAITACSASGPTSATRADDSRPAFDGDTVGKGGGPTSGGH